MIWYKPRSCVGRIILRITMLNIKRLIKDYTEIRNSRVVSIPYCHPEGQSSSLGWTNIQREYRVSIQGQKPLPTVEYYLGLAIYIPEIVTFFFSFTERLVVRRLNAILSFWSCIFLINTNTLTSIFLCSCICIKIYDIVCLCMVYVIVAFKEIVSHFSRCVAFTNIYICIYIYVF